MPSMSHHLRKASERVTLCGCRFQHKGPRTIANQSLRLGGADVHITTPHGVAHHGDATVRFGSQCPTTSSCAIAKRLNAQGKPIQTRGRRKMRQNQDHRAGAAANTSPGAKVRSSSHVGAALRFACRFFGLACAAGHPAPPARDRGRGAPHRGPGRWGDAGLADRRPAGGHSHGRCRHRAAKGDGVPTPTKLPTRPWRRKARPPMAPQRRRRPR